MPRSNPHARERVMDDRKHLDALACSYPSRGAKHRSCLRLVRRVGALSKLLRAQSVTKRCSRRRRVRALLPLFQAGKDLGLGALGPCRRWKPLARAGKIVNRTARSLALVGAPQGGSMNENRSDGKPSVVLPGDESQLGPAAIRRRRTDRAPARPAGASEEPTFRKGRAHDRFVVAEVGRTAVVVVNARSNGRPERRCRSETQRGATLEA